MQAFAIEAFRELSARWIWPALLHSVWIGLVTASMASLLIEGMAHLSHRARHAILLGAFALVAVGPLLATALPHAIAIFSTVETTSEREIIAFKKAVAETVTRERREHSPMPVAHVRSHAATIRVRFLESARENHESRESRATLSGCRMAALRRQPRRLHCARSKNGSALASRSRSRRARHPAKGTRDGPAAGAGSGAAGARPSAGGRAISWRYLPARDPAARAAGSSACPAIAWTRFWPTSLHTRGGSTTSSTSRSDLSSCSCSFTRPSTGSRGRCAGSESSVPTPWRFD